MTTVPRCVRQPTREIPQGRQATKHPKPPLEKTMKIPLELALIGLAISFALPTLAQQKDTVDSQIRPEQPIAS